MKDAVNGEKTNRGRVIALLLFMIPAIGFIVFYNAYLSEHPMKSILSVDMFTYNTSLEDGYRLYIRENDVYTPYLVLYDDYDKNGNCLLLREQVIGSETNGVFEMSAGEEYKDTEIDRYLHEEFETRFDKKVFAMISDAKLNLSHIVNGTDINYTIFRKCFLLSNIELGYGDTYDDNTKNRNVLEYFDVEGRSAENDGGTVVPWWTRTLCLNAYGAVGIDGKLIPDSEGDAKYGVRPAILLPGETPVIKYHDERLGDIYILEADQRQ